MTFFNDIVPCRMGYPQRRYIIEKLCDRWHDQFAKLEFDGGIKNVQLIKVREKGFVSSMEGKTQHKDYLLTEKDVQALFEYLEEQLV